MSKFKLEDPLSWISGEGDKSVQNLEIETDKIRVVYAQPRTNIENESLAELENSIMERGIIEPLIVKQDGEFYNLVCGERRLRCANKIGLAKVPVAIRNDIKDEDIFLIQILENIQRKDLDPLELGEAYSKLCENRTIEEVANLVVKPKTHIADMLALLSLEEGIKAKISKHNVRKVIEIGRIKNKKIRKELISNFDSIEIKDVKNKKFSGKKNAGVEELVNEFNGTHESKIEVVFSKKYSYINVKLSSSIRPLKILKEIIKIKEN